jgi:hypothetical protein
MKKTMKILKLSFQCLISPETDPLASTTAQSEFLELLQKAESSSKLRRMDTIR